MAKTIITAALTGAVTPAGYKIPETPQQIANEAYDAWKLGAAVVHLHMRADDGLGAMDKEKFRETIKLIRSHKDCDVIINCTSSGASRSTPPPTTSAWPTTGSCPASRWAPTTRAPSTGCPAACSSTPPVSPEAGRSLHGEGHQAGAGDL